VTNLTGEQNITLAVRGVVPQRRQAMVTKKPRVDDVADLLVIEHEVNELGDLNVVDGDLGLVRTGDDQEETQRTLILRDSGAGQDRPWSARMRVWPFPHLKAGACTSSPPPPRYCSASLSSSALAW
jgi:hypothetical protein